MANEIAFAQDVLVKQARHSSVAPEFIRGAIGKLYFPCAYFDFSLKTSFDPCKRQVGGSFCGCCFGMPTDPEISRFGQK